MFSTLLIVVLVVVWLLVLIPMVVDTKEPIRRTSQAFTSTRVLHKSEHASRFRRRRRLPVVAEDTIAEREDITDDSSDDGAEDTSNVADDSSRDDTHYDEEHSAVAEPDADSTADTVVVPLPSEVSEDVVQESLDNYRDTSRDIAIDADLDGDVAAHEENPEAASQPQPSLSDLSGSLPARIARLRELDRHLPDITEDVPLSAEDVEYAHKRRGRGIYDPAADQRVADRRYRRRRITMILLLSGLVAWLVTAGVLGKQWWIAPVAWTGIITLYLTVLRSQVRLEQQIRDQRRRRLQYARRANEIYETEVAAGQRRPIQGSFTLLHPDDDDPLFDILETYNFMETFSQHLEDDVVIGADGYARDRFGRVQMQGEYIPHQVYSGDLHYRSQPQQASAPYMDYADVDMVDRYAAYVYGDYVGSESADYWGDGEDANRGSVFTVHPDPQWEYMELSQGRSTA